MRIYFWLLISCCFLFFSCEKEIPFPDKIISPTLVANAFMTPDSVWQLRLSKSAPIDSVINFEYVTNAEASIKNLATNKLIQLTHQENGTYLAQESLPEIGQAYQLVAKVPDFPTITATSVIPKSFDALYLKSQKSVYQKEANYLFDLLIVDNKAESNYYLFEVQYLVETQTDKILENATLFSFDSNSENETIVIDHFKLKRSFLTDENFNGQNYITQIGATSSLLENLSSEVHLKAIISIKSITEEGYSYFKSIERFENADNEIFTEPLSVFSKIENGFGIFAGYTEQRIEIILQ